jgi:hypothetical protein
VAVYDLSGRRVAQPASGQFAAGRHVVAFDGRGLSSGVYVVQLKALGRVAQTKVVLVK